MIDSSFYLSEKPTVLVVDDTPDNLFLMQALLKHKYKVKGIPLHTSPRFAELPGVAGTFDKDGYLLQAQP